MRVLGEPWSPAFALVKSAQSRSQEVEKVLVTVTSLSSDSSTSACLPLVTGISSLPGQPRPPEEARMVKKIFLFGAETRSPLCWFRLLPRAQSTRQCPAQRSASSDALFDLHTRTPTFLVFPGESQF